MFRQIIPSESLEMEPGSRLLLSAALSVRLPRSQEMFRLVNYVSAILVIFMVIKIYNSSRYDEAIQELIVPKENAAYVHWEVAEKLKQLGLRETWLQQNLNVDSSQKFNSYPAQKLGLNSAEIFGKN